MNKLLMGVGAVGVLALSSPAQASSCVTEDQCLCRSASGVADVETLRIEETTTFVRVNAATESFGLEEGAELGLDRRSTDAVGERRLVYLNDDRRLLDAVPVVNGEVTCAVTQKTFVLPADEAFAFAADQATCSQKMQEAGLVEPECSGNRIEPALSIGCTAVPGWFAAGGLAWMGALVRRRRFGKI